MLEAAQRFTSSAIEALYSLIRSVGWFGLLAVAAVAIALAYQGYAVRRSRKRIGELTATLSTERERLTRLRTRVPPQPAPQPLPAKGKVPELPEELVQAAVANGRPDYGRGLLGASFSACLSLYGARSRPNQADRGSAASGNNRADLAGYSRSAQLAELGKKTDAINQLKKELAETKVTNLALEARDRTRRDQLSAREKEYQIKSGALSEAERQLADKETELTRLLGGRALIAG